MEVMEMEKNGSVWDLESTRRKLRSSASKDSTPSPLGLSDTSSLWNDRWAVGLGDRWAGKVTPDLCLMTGDIKLGFEEATGTLLGKWNMSLEDQ